MSFDHLMQPREISSLALQIRHAYGYNKRALRPYKMYLTSLDEEKGLTCQLLKKDGGYDRWLMCKTSKHYVETFGNEKAVYLTADSETVLETLDDNTTYIIGGLVDKNRYKGLCFEEAKKREVRTARLPIGKYLEGNSRKVGIDVTTRVEISRKTCISRFPSSFSFFLSFFITSSSVRYYNYYYYYYSCVFIIRWSL